MADYIAHGGNGNGTGGNTTVPGGSGATERSGSAGGAGKPQLESSWVGGGGGGGAPGMSGLGVAGSDGGINATNGGAGGDGSGGAVGGIGEDGGISPTNGVDGVVGLTVEGGAGGGGGCDGDPGGSPGNTNGVYTGGDGGFPGGGGAHGAYGASPYGDGGAGGDGVVVFIYGNGSYTSYTSFITGSGSWSLPGGNDRVKAIAIGAGAGGPATRGFPDVAGGSGGYVEQEFLTSSISFDYVVGAGGVGKVQPPSCAFPGCEGTDGGDSSFTEAAVSTVTKTASLDAEVIKARFISFDAVVSQINPPKVKIDRYRHEPVPAEYSPWYFQSEFLKLEVITDLIIRGSIESLHVEPVKVRDGLIVIADGVDWDPGSGVGIYYYYNGGWRFLG